MTENYIRMKRYAVKTDGAIFDSILRDVACNGMVVSCAPYNFGRTLDFGCVLDLVLPTWRAFHLPAFRI